MLAFLLWERYLKAVSTHISTQIVNPAMLGATLNIRMVTWKYLNFTVKVRLNSRVFAIEEKIRQHHGGSVHQVFLYNGIVAPENLLSEPSLTLFEAGFEGDIEGSEPEHDVWYVLPMRLSDWKFVT
jgi:hypothetical protein